MQFDLFIISPFVPERKRDRRLFNPDVIRTARPNDKQVTAYSVVETFSAGATRSST